MRHRQLMMSAAVALVLAALADGAMAQTTAGAPQDAQPGGATPEAADDAWVNDLDPDAPLDPLPDLDVPWPDFDTPPPEPPPLPPLTAPLAELPLPSPPPSGETPAMTAAVDPDADLALPPSVGPALADATDDVADSVPVIAQTSADGLVRYNVELGDFGEADDGEFASRFAALSALRAGDDDPANSAQLNRRIAEDSELLQQLLRNSGYYDATLNSEVQQQGDRLTIRFSALTGPLYRYDDVRLNGFDVLPSDEATRLRGVFPVASGDIVNADDLLTAQALLEVELRETGYAFADVGEELVTVDHDTRLADLDQPVVPGERLRFGRIVANDGGLLGARHLQRIARFRPGEWYRQSQVEDLRRAIIATGLVASADLTPVAAEPGSVDLAVALEPAPPRTLAGAIGYGSGEGFRLEASWEHRNLFPPEGALIARGVLGTQEQLGSLTFRRSNFLRRDHVLSVQALVSNLDRFAFRARTALLSARLERQSTLIFQKRWTWSVGAELVATDESDFRRIAGGGRRAYFVGALPMTLGYDRSNDLLDPTRGFRLLARLSPELSIRGDTFGYVRAQLDGSGYWPVTNRVVLAGRVRVGTIAGSSVDAIAPSRRFYAGGGGSVRGYGFQRIGPLTPAGDPEGGRSLFEAAAEARIRLAAFGGNFSIVPFIDAGNVYRTEYPDFSGLRIGAGIGVRYHSSFGPIRVDVGTPLNPRGDDPRIGVYVSLGQAF